MFNLVKIGEKELPMLSMASVDYYFRHIFGRDPIKLQADNSDDIGAMYDFIFKMGYVMNRFAELKDKKEMFKLTEDSFYDWTEQFERNDLIDALEDIQLTYEGQAVTRSVAKKKSEELTER